MQMSSEHIVRWLFPSLFKEGILGQKQKPFFSNNQNAQKASPPASSLRFAHGGARSGERFPTGLLAPRARAHVSRGVLETECVLSGCEREGMGGLGDLRCEGLGQRHQKGAPGGRPMVPGVVRTTARPSFV